MTGARRLAQDYIIQKLRGVQRVLDVCCGDGWTFEMVLAAGCKWHGIDKGGMNSMPGCPRRILGDVTRAEVFLSTPECSDLVLDVYGTQHLLDCQGLAWHNIVTEMTDRGRFISVGRYADMPGRETNREDPLNAHNKKSLEGMALGCGLRMVDFMAFTYEGETYKALPPDYRGLMDCEPNAYAATFERW